MRNAALVVVVLLLPTLVFATQPSTPAGSQPLLATDLHVAVAQCDIDSISRILESGRFSLDQRDLALDTPLHTSIKGKCYEASNLLLKAGFDPAALDIEGRSVINAGLKAFIMSSETGDFAAADIFDRMVAAVDSSSLTHPDMKRRTTVSTLKSLLPEVEALRTGGKSKHFNRHEAIQQRLDSRIGKDITVPEPVDTRKPQLQTLYDRAHKQAKKQERPYATPKQVHDAAENMALQATAKHYATLPELLKGKDADLRTIIHVAAGWNYISVVEMLLNIEGADINAIDFSGKTIAHNPARFGSAEMITYLCSNRQFDVNQKDHYGFTPFQHAQYKLMMQGKPKIDDYQRTKSAFAGCGVDVETEEAEWVSRILSGSTQ